MITMKLLKALFLCLAVAATTAEATDSLERCLSVLSRNSGADAPGQSSQNVHENGRDERIKPSSAKQSVTRDGTIAWVWVGDEHSPLKVKKLEFAEDVKSNPHLPKSEIHGSDVMRTGQNAKEAKVDYLVVETTTTVIILFVMSSQEWESTSIIPPHIQCYMTTENQGLTMHCVAEVFEDAENFLLGFVSIKREENFVIDEEAVRLLIQCLSHAVYKMPERELENKGVPKPQKDSDSALSGLPSLPRSRSSFGRSTASSPATDEIELDLETFWNRASSLRWSIYDVSSIWFPYQYDDTTNPIDSILDGGYDMFDRGNQLKFCEDLAELSEYLIYGNISNFRNYDVVAGGFFPFMALAWIRNEGGESHNYTMKVIGNLGADGDGFLEQFQGVLTLLSTFSVQYHVFQVYGTEDPSVCEVYFTITNQAWGSVAGSSFVASFSDETDEVINSVTLSGSPKNVLVGYILLSVINETKVDETNIQGVLTELVNALNTAEEEVIEQCGGIYSFLNGSDTFAIASPSSYSYTSNTPFGTECNYEIIAEIGARVEITLYYNGRNDYLNIVDNGRYTSISSRSHEIIWTSSSERLSLRYQSYFYGYNPLSFGSSGFSAKLRQFFPTCGFSGRLNSTSTTFTSPDYPNGYSSISYCHWRIDVDWGTLYSVTLNNLDLPGDDDVLVINDGRDFYHYNNGDTAGASVKYFSNGNDISIYFRGGAHALNEGFSVTIAEASCDETYNLTDTSSRSVKAVFPSHTYRRCSYRFFALAGYNIDVKVSFEKPVSSTIYSDIALQVMDGTTTSGYVYSGINKTTITSSGNYLQISWDGYFYGNITMTYWQFQSNCGFNNFNITSFTSNFTSGVIKSPSHPNANGEVEDCIWIIRHPAWNTQLQIELDTLTLLPESGYLEIGDDFSTIARYESSLSAPVKLFATSGRLRVRYHAEASVGALGFEGTYDEGNCDQIISISDDSSATIRPKQVTRNHYSNYGYLQCTTTIIAQANHFVELTVLFGGIYQNSLMITDGNNTKHISRYDNSRYKIISSGSTIKIKYDYFVYYYGIGQETFFDLTYRQVSYTCGQRTTSQTFLQSIVFPNYPNDYNNNLECLWIIEAESDYITRLTIQDLTLDSDEDYLDIIADNGELVRYDETITAPVDFTSPRGGQALVRFSTDNAGVGKGFNLTYEKATCGRDFHMSNDLGSPYYSYNTNIPSYSSNNFHNINNVSDIACKYSFTAETGNKVEMHVFVWDLTSCCWYLEVFDGSTKVGYHDSNSPTATYISTEQTMTIVYHNNGTFADYYGSQAYAYATQFVLQCGHVRTADTTVQTITSPSYPNIYPNNARCIWTIDIPAEQKLRFTIVFLDLAEGDNLEVSNGEKTQIRFTGLIATPRNISIDGPRVRIQFISDYFTSRKGFTATYVLDQSPCSSDPCENNGICSDADDQFSCLCPENYIGSMCETFVSPCNANPCLNGGTCVPTTTEPMFECRCTDDFAGNLCFAEVNECFPNNPCAANANCTDVELGYNCTCIDGYRGDGKVKCYEIVLLPYGTDVGDTLLDVKDDAVSEALWIDYEVPMGSRSYSTFRVTSNGLIIPGWWLYFLSSLHHPPVNGFTRYVPLLAPFWDDFQPHPTNKGRVYYHIYDKRTHSLDTAGASLFLEVQKRIQDKFNVVDFIPSFILKATWHEVVMFPFDALNHDQFPSTFQAILASDGCDTYVIYIYEEDGMTWQEGLRSSDAALIGYTNGAEMERVVYQGHYRPDQSTNGLVKGQYIFHLTATKSATQIARCGCSKWYLEDVETDWNLNWIPCPCTNFQASEDQRFALSVDNSLEQNLERNGSFRTADIREWRLDSVRSSQCYQPRNGIGPRCCYRVQTSSWTNSWWWGWWWFWGGLVRGPLGSRYERYQIPIMDNNGRVDTRDEATFNQQYNDALYGDLIPRRQCCVESHSWRYCDMYQERRPAATCWGYVWQGRVFTWGDPHFTTLDGATYTFNGLGEFHLVKADGVFSLQARTTRVEKSDGSLTEATSFVSFVAQDHQVPSGKVQFEVDYSDATGTGVLVKVADSLQTGLSESETVVDSVTLSVTNGSYKAIFPSLHSVTVSSSAFLLTIQFGGDSNLLQGVSKGLLGYWNGNKEDDFQMRNGTTLNYENLKVTENLDILNNSLSERKLYDFGLSWRVSGSESLFTYAGGNDTYANHNPSNSPFPPFLEDLVAAQRTTAAFNSILNNCTTDGSLSTTCLYDTLTTNNTQIGQTTLNQGFAFEFSRTVGANTPPNASVEASPNFVDGFLQVTINTISRVIVAAEDVDGDTVTFAVDESSTVPNVNIDSASGMLTWTPMATLDPDKTSLIIVAFDGNLGETLLTIPIKFCPCPSANGECLFNSTLSGSEDYQIVNCNCTEAWSGDNCTEDRNACPSACYTGVTCTDVVAPGVGEDCGPCPAGTAGNGRNCTTIDLCLDQPCQHVCTARFGGFNCSCMDGYTVNAANNTLCDDIDECEINKPCDKIDNTTCINTPGSYRCDCAEGFDWNINTCVDRDECMMGSHNCSTKTSTCHNEVGTFSCSCQRGYANYSGNGTCQNIDECINSTMNTCSVNATCNDTDGGYTCTCLKGYTGDGKVCKTETSSDPCDGVQCPPDHTCQSKGSTYECNEDGGAALLGQTRVFIFLQVLTVTLVMLMTA